MFSEILRKLNTEYYALALVKQHILHRSGKLGLWELELVGHSDEYEILGKKQRKTQSDWDGGGTENASVPTDGYVCEPIRSL
jgi:hypothetical protein